jgi:hypothetical protein
MAFIDWVLNTISNGERMSIMDYLKTEIKPDIQALRRDHLDLREKVAALPTRAEVDTQLDRIHKRIDTKMDKTSG